MPTLIIGQKSEERSGDHNLNEPQKGNWPALLSLFMYLHYFFTVEPL